MFSDQVNDTFCRINKEKRATRGVCVLGGGDIRVLKVAGRKYENQQVFMNFQFKMI